LISPTWNLKKMVSTINIWMEEERNNCPKKKSKSCGLCLHL